MAKIDHIESISDALGQSTIAVLPKRCSYIRNWNSKCALCMNACEHDAIKRSLGHLSIDPEACTNCGACVTACPTSAFVTTAPDSTEIVREARLSAAENEGHAVFACAQLLEHQDIDTSKVAVLPCLDYLDEYLICGLFAVGVKSSTLLKSDCASCPIDCQLPRVDETVRSAKRLLAAWSVDAHVRLTDKIPMQVRPSRKQGRGRIGGQSRRASFKQAGGSVLGYVAQAVSDTLDNLDNKPKPKRDEQIIVRLDEVFPADTYRSVRMAAMLDRIGTRPRGQLVESRFWANVNIDPSACRYCGMCANMCATRALTYSKDEETGTGTLQFRPSLCVNCRLCKDTCLSRSMVYDNKVLADDLDADVTHVLFEHTETAKKPFHFN